MAVEIFDTPNDVTKKLPALVKAGAKTAIRYISSINPSGEKCIKKPEAEAIGNAGLTLGIVHEGWGGANGRGISAQDGHRDGPWSVRYMPSIGAGRSAVVYFAVDTDESAAAIKSQVLPYFSAIKEAFDGSQYAVGVYGSGSVLSAVTSAGFATYTWLSCSKGWAGYKDWLKKANLIQYTPVKLLGLDVDPDIMNSAFGDFVPFAAEQTKTPQPTETTGFNLAGLWKKVTG